MLVSRNAEEAQAAADKIAAEYGCKAIGFAADVSKQADMEAMVARCLDEFGRIDILVNSWYQHGTGRGICRPSRASMWTARPVARCCRT